MGYKKELLHSVPSDGSSLHRNMAEKRVLEMRNRIVTYGAMTGAGEGESGGECPNRQIGDELFQMALPAMSVKSHVQIRKSVFLTHVGK